MWLNTFATVNDIQLLSRLYQKLDVSGLLSSKCRHVVREEKRIVQRRSQS